MFLDKGNILSELNKFACLPGVMYVSLYSREGMGKTRLIQEFSSGKKFFTLKRQLFFIRKILYFSATPAPGN